LNHVFSGREQKKKGRQLTKRNIFEKVEEDPLFHDFAARYYVQPMNYNELQIALMVFMGSRMPDGSSGRSSSASSVTSESGK
jgi:hypothetical protein